MKRFLLFLLVVALVCIGAHVLAAENYSVVKGDFCIFCLGDDIDTVKDKIDYLTKEKIINEGREIRYIGSTITIANMYINEKKILCNLFLDSNKKIDEIELLFPESYSEQQFNAVFLDDFTRVKFELSKQYGEPIESNPIPKYKELNTSNFDIVTRMQNIYIWSQNGRRICLGVDSSPIVRICIMNEKSYLGKIHLYQTSPFFLMQKQLDILTTTK